MTVTPDKIAVALGVAAPETGSPMWEQWAMWIDDAVMLINDRATQLSIVPDGLEPAKVDYVVREAVAAQVRRPDDATQVTVSVDDGSTSKTYRSGKGRVSILDEWWALLGLTPTSGAFSIDTAPAGTVHLPWCSSQFGALYCSCGADIAGTPIFEVDPW
jgi:hypothetical protein